MLGTSPLSFLPLSALVGPDADPSEVWDHVLPNGQTAGATLVAVFDMLSELHALHGLRSGAPLVVSGAQRSVASILQSVDDASGVVTVTRLS